MEQPDVLRYAIEALQARGVAYMLVGSMASGMYGEPRSTLDIDIVIDLRLEDIDWLCGAFPVPDFYLSRDAVAIAVQRRKQFNVIHPASGNKIDFMLAKFTEWGRLQLSRRRAEEIFPGLVGYAAAPEDIILSKMNYFQEGGSDRQLRDCAGMLKVSGSKIDRQYLSEWAAKLNLVGTWQRLVESLEQTDEAQP